ncbi:hypothetical protein BBD42_30930 [Paenibacillus sp. BIHB 4019]|uniref:Tyr recombinase domain-containing protein n=1 Tax=Paenibacillus sp. BIHB 4019 TaxID=1870819 RepID=A0A1B2DRT2_9BACL|nr:tyrosine-type recombinase/integrase [Paenibacillus sp. BIHB 4019]ANY70419.1 hypothetical protein BBD42_30930 [Paenibacillus sp. BIHB 4019]
MEEVQPIRDKTILNGMINYFKASSQRNYIFFMMGIHSGLRVSDLLKLKVGDVRDEHVNFVAEKTKNRRKKRKRQKFIIHHVIRDDLMRYIASKDDDEYLFPSRQRKKLTGAAGEPIDRVTAYRMIRDAAARFGLKEIGTHSLRKTWGYHMYTENPRNLALLMKMFGHEDMTTTLLYIGLTQDEMDESIQALSLTQIG